MSDKYKFQVQKLSVRRTIILNSQVRSRFLLLQREFRVPNYQGDSLSPL